MEERLDKEMEPAQAAILWASTYILMGLRYPPALAAQLLRGVRNMKESTTYQAILEEGAAQGRADEARLLLLLLGDKRFGAADARIRRAIESITSVERLEQLTARILDVSNWDELLTQ